MLLYRKKRSRTKVLHQGRSTEFHQEKSSHVYLKYFSIKLFIDIVPDFAVDVPLVWQYVAEIFGAFIGAPSSNMNLLKSILQPIPQNKVNQVFQDIVRYAIEFSVRRSMKLVFHSL